MGLWLFLGWVWETLERLGIFGQIGFVLDFWQIDWCFLDFFGNCKMSGSGSNSAFPLPPKIKNFAGNTTDIGWKHGTDASGNGKKK